MRFDARVASWLLVGVCCLLGVVCCLCCLACCSLLINCLSWCVIRCRLLACLFVWSLFVAYCVDVLVVFVWLVVVGCHAMFVCCVFGVLFVVCCIIVCCSVVAFWLFAVRCALLIVCVCRALFVTCCLSSVVCCV